LGEPTQKGHITNNIDYIISYLLYISYAIMLGIEFTISKDKIKTIYYFSLTTPIILIPPISILIKEKDPSPLINNLLCSISVLLSLLNFGQNTGVIVLLVSILSTIIEIPNPENTLFPAESTVFITIIILIQELNIQLATIAIVIMYALFKSKINIEDIKDIITEINSNGDSN